MCAARDAGGWVWKDPSEVREDVQVECRGKVGTRAKWADRGAAHRLCALRAADCFGLCGLRMRGLCMRSAAPQSYEALGQRGVQPGVAYVAWGALHMPKPTTRACRQVPPNTGRQVGGSVGNPSWRPHPCLNGWNPHSFVEYGYAQEIQARRGRERRAAYPRGQRASRYDSETLISEAAQCPFLLRPHPQLHPFREAHDGLRAAQMSATSTMAAV